MEMYKAMTHPLPNQQGSEQARLIADLIFGEVGKKLETQGYILLPAQAELFANYILQDRRSTAHDVCQAIVSKGPEDMLLTKNESDSDYFYGLGNNQSNAQWRQAITEVGKEYESE